jgi:putative hydrolase of the HAD superfamily
MTNPAFKAVLWDFGGVILDSPFTAFGRYEEARGLPRDFLRRVNSVNPDSNAWARLERSEVTPEEFDGLFAAESEALGHRVAGADILPLLSGSVRPEMVEALRRVRRHYRIACLTNNVATGSGPGMARDPHRAAEIAEVMTLFEQVFESSKVGTRKPDPAFYRHACATMDLDPADCIYLDDLGINLKPAKSMGMTTIKVLDAPQALVELEALLDLPLRA